MSFPFIGRKHELELLKRLLQKSIASLVVVKGRRRIGKSRLIEEFAKDYTFYHFSGIPPSSQTTHLSQLDEFSEQLSHQMGTPIIKVENWNQQFYLLAEKIKTGRVIVLFDEISWMGTKDPDFLGKLKNAWDIYFKKNPQLIFFLCGSVSSWIEKNILSSTGFVGRISFRLTVEELPLQDCNEFWLRKNSYISPYEKLKVLSVVGGIPRYLEELNTKLPSDENIQRLCFQKGGLLVHEFNHLFSDLFSHRSALYKKIVEVLAKGPMEAKDISTALGLVYTGAINKYLKDLVLSGFLSRDYTWHFSSGKEAKLSHFRLSDNYVRFYLKYIDPVIGTIEKGRFDFSSLNLMPDWDSIMGYQCENLVLRNRDYIQERLNIKPDQIVSDNPYFQRKTAKNPGCQIDYLIQTRYNGLFVCEMKFSTHAIGTEVIHEVQKKIDRLVYPKGFSVWPVLIHVNGVTDEVSERDFFSHIIDFGRILASPKDNA